MDLRSSPQPVSTSGSTALVHGGAHVHSLRTRSWPSRCRPPRRLHVQAALKEKEGLAVSYKQQGPPHELLLRVPIEEGVRGGDVQWEVHPTRLRLAVRDEVLLEGDFGGHPVNHDDCFWTIEEDDGKRFIEITIAKGRQDVWKQVLESEDSASAKAAVTDYVFLDVAEDGKAIGRVTLGLFGGAAPKTVENFRALATGEKGSNADGVPLHFKGSTFHRIIPGFMIQGGDFTHGDGTGGESVYGGSFDDENFDIAHDDRFLLSMANAGPNTNGSQFFITLNPQSHLDGKHTVFGKVVAGFDNVSRIAHCGSASGKPSKTITIADCGQLDAADVQAEEFENKILGGPAAPAASAS